MTRGSIVCLPVLLSAVVMLTAALVVSAYAEPVTDAVSSPPHVDVDRELQQSLGVPEIESAVPGDAADILDGLSVSDSLQLDKGLAKIRDALTENTGGIFRAGIASAAKMLAVAALCALAGSVYDSGSVPDYVPLCGVLSVSVIAAGDLRTFIGLGSETIRLLSGFSKVLLPGIAAAAASAGALTSASAKYAATALFFDLLLTVTANVVTPLLYAYIAATIANAATGSNALTACANMIKWLCSTLLTTLVIAFTLYLSLTAIITGTSDAAVTRFAKTAISAALPVVGSIVADAASTVVAGAATLRSAIGVFGMLAVLCVCLLPFLNLGVHYLCYKAAAGLSAALPDKRLSSLMSGIGSAFGIVMAVVGSGCVMLFFSIISSIKAVTGS